MNRSTPWICLMGIGGLLVGCNNGGASGPTLRAVSQFPAPGSVAPTDTTIRLVFASEPAPDPATITSDALRVFDGAGLFAGSAAYDAANLTLTWTGTGEFPRGALLTAELSDTVVGVNGMSSHRGLAWSFRVRAGVAAPPVVLTNAANGDGVHVGIASDGAALVIAGAESWTWDHSGVGSAEALPAVAQSLYVDPVGNATVAMRSGSNIDVAKRPSDGAWSPPETVATIQTPYLVASLQGNARGDVLLVADYHYGTPHIYGWLVYAHLAGGTTGWMRAPSSYGSGGFSALREFDATIDGLGGVAVMFSRGYNAMPLMIDRWDPQTGATSSYELGVGHPVPQFITGKRDGGLRALWSPAVQSVEVLMSQASPNGGFETPVPGPAIGPGYSLWTSNASGAMLARSGSVIWRCEGDSDNWSMADTGRDLIAAAMSSRGEAVMLSREAGSIFLTRWRAREVIDAPILLTTTQVFYQAQFAVAVSDLGHAIVVHTTDTPGEVVGVRVE